MLDISRVILLVLYGFNIGERDTKFNLWSPKISQNSSSVKFINKMLNAQDSFFNKHLKVDF